MSLQATSWALDQVEADPNFKIILFALGDHANQDHECWPGIQLIAKRACISTRTVKRRLAALADYGVITIIPRSAGYNGRGNTYRLHVGQRFNLMEADQWERIPEDLPGHPEAIGDNLSPLENGQRGQSVPSNGDTAVSPRMGTQLCPPNHNRIVKESINNNIHSYAGGAPEKIPIDWQPTAETAQLLADQGVPLWFIDDMAGPFRLYWLDRGGVNHSWESMFYRWCLDKWNGPPVQQAADQRFGGFANVSD